MSALTDDRLKFRPVDVGWTLPDTVAEFLAFLSKTPALGRTDAERVHRFLTLPQADSMPTELRTALTRRFGE